MTRSTLAATRSADSWILATGCPLRSPHGESAGWRLPMVAGVRGGFAVSHPGRGWDHFPCWRRYPRAGSLRHDGATTLDGIHPHPSRPAPREAPRHAMTDTVLQSFCERCGTRYTVEVPQEKPEPPPSVLGRFKRKAPEAHEHGSAPPAFPS